LSLVSVVCRQVEVSASVCSLVWMIPTECGVSECDRETAINGDHGPTTGRTATGKKKIHTLAGDEGNDFVASGK